MRKKGNKGPKEAATQEEGVPLDSFQKMVGIRDVAAGVSVYETTSDQYERDDDSGYNEETYELGDLIVSVNLNRRFEISNRGVSDQYTVFDGYVDVGDTVYVVIERYDDYDTFGRRSGLATILSVHATEARARAAEAAAYEDHRKNPRGWGHSLQSISVYSTEVVI